MKRKRESAANRVAALRHHIETVPITKNIEAKATILSNYAVLARDNGFTRFPEVRKQLIKANRQLSRIVEVVSAAFHGRTPL